MCWARAEKCNERFASRALVPRLALYLGPTIKRPANELTRLITRLPYGFLPRSSRFASIGSDRGTIVFVEKKIFNFLEWIISTKWIYLWKYVWKLVFTIALEIGENLFAKYNYQSMDSNGLEIKNYLIFPVAISRISSDDPHFQFRNCSINQSIFPRFETTNSKRVRIEVYELNVSLYFHPRLGQLLFSPASITVHRFSHLSKLVRTNAYRADIELEVPFPGEPPGIPARATYSGIT